MQVTQEIKLNINQTADYLYISAKQADDNSRFLKITMMDNQTVLPVPSDAIASLRALKPDGTSILDSGTVNEDGTITVELTDQVLAVEGIVRADVSTAQNGQILSSATFLIRVGAVPIGTEVVSSNEFLQLVELYEEISTLMPVHTDDIADGAVTSDKLANDAVTSGKIADGAVGTADLADGAVTNAKIAEGTITGNKFVPALPITEIKSTSGAKYEQSSTTKLGVTHTALLTTSDHYQNALGAVAFSTTATYAVGDYVVYDKQVYKCINAHTGAWSASDFEQTKIMPRLDEVEEDVTTINSDLSTAGKELYMGYAYNPDNLFKDYQLKTATALTENVSITAGLPSGVIEMNNTSDTTLVRCVQIPLWTVLDKTKSYYLHCKVRNLRNSSYNFKNPIITIGYLLNGSLKSSQNLSTYAPVSSDDANAFKDYALLLNLTSNADAIVMYCQYGYHTYVKELYITEGADSQNVPLYKYIPLVDSLNGFKLAIIGDSLSAVSAGVPQKYHDLLKTNDNYVINNVAVSGSSYCNGSLYNGTRNHQFYNQASHVPADSDGCIVFGSFNDMSLLSGRYYIYNSSDAIIGEGNAGIAPSSSATLLSTDESTAHWYTHNAESAITAGTYRMVCDDTTYQFTTTVDVPQNGYLKMRIVTLGEIGTDDNDVDTIVGAFTTMLNNLYAINNGMIIGIVSPTPWSLYNSVSPYSDYTLSACTAYVNKIKELARHYMLPFLNLYEESNLRPWDSDFRTDFYNSADGVHPNSNGHAIYIYPHMREFVSTFNYKNI